jgi:hypothetical protein
MLSVVKLLKSVSPPKDPHDQSQIIAETEGPALRNTIECRKKDIQTRTKEGDTCNQDDTSNDGDKAVEGDRIADIGPLVVLVDSIAVVFI